EKAGRSPGRYFALLVIISSIAYVPSASVFEPWYFSQLWGPFSFQPGRLLDYAVYFFAGAGVGAQGIERGLLGSSGMLARRWALWFVGGLATFLLWMMATALTMDPPQLTIPGIQAIPGLGIAADFLFALSSATACFGF